MAGGGIFTALVLLAMLPFAAAWDIHKICPRNVGSPCRFVIWAGLVGARLP